MRNGSEGKNGAFPDQYASFRRLTVEETLGKAAAAVYLVDSGLAKA